MNRSEIIARLRARNISFSESATDTQLLQLLNEKCTIRKAINYATGRIDIAFNEATEEPAEIMICEEIGEDPWTGNGITVKDIRDTLKEITPRGRALNFLTNSPGGSVSEGNSIRNLLNEWPGRITNTIIGVAASTASWCIPADEVRAYKSSQMFLHRSFGWVMGNADDMRSAIQFLETTDDQIAEIYSDQTGKEKSEMADLMNKETLLTGQQAKDLGLVDVLIDGEAKNSFTKNQIDAMKRKLAALNSVRNPARPQGNNQQQQNTMNRKQKIALLNQRGINVADDATDAWLDESVAKSNSIREKNIAVLNKWKVPVPENATDAQILVLVEAGRPAVVTDPKILELENKIATLTTANSEANRIRITGEVQTLVDDDKLPAALKDEAIRDCIANPDRLQNFYQKMPARPPGSEPLSASNIDITSESFKDIQNFILDNSSRFREKFLGRNAQVVESQDEDGRRKIAKEISSRAIIAANAINKHKDKLIIAWNANAIDAALQRQIILQEMLEAYAIVIINLDVFSTVFANVPLEGTDKVEVPYFPLQATASNSFDATTGYATASDWTENSREIPVGGDGNAAASGANAAANTARDRKYQKISFTSYDLRRQPYLNLVKLYQQAANKLGVDVFTDIVSRVVNAANFGASVKAVPAAAMTADDVADLRQVATAANWPVMGRSLVLDHTYYTPLLKDNSFKQYLSYGNSDPIQLGRIKNAYGFENIVEVPNLSNYSPANQFLRGFITHKSAVLVATSPIMPTPEVLNLLTRYDVVVDPKTGIAFEYRRFGDAVLDKTHETVEVSYGAAKGVDAALARITSQ